MELNSFGYRGSFVFNPPIIKKGISQNLLIAATAYGSNADLSSCIDQFLSEIHGQLDDLDSTSAYPRLTCLNQHENLIFTSIQFLNDYIYSNFNKDNFRLGCDLICLYRVKNTLYFCQVGWPLLVLNHKNKNIPISSEYAFSPKDPQKSPFLPHNLFGLESSVNIKIQQIGNIKDSSLLILKSNESPDSLLSLYPCPLKNIARVFAEENPAQGFWLGEIKFS